VRSPSAAIAAQVRRFTPEGGRARGDEAQKTGLDELGIPAIPLDFPRFGFLSGNVNKRSALAAEPEGRLNSDRRERPILPDSYVIPRLDQV